ncbi:MAG: trypsin-like serine protease, partial [Solirubrobacterales bacterium]
VAGRDSCSGDSGGPLTIGDASAPKLLGVTSYGRGCGRSGFPGVYSDVLALTSFITNPEPIFAPAPSQNTARVIGRPRAQNKLRCSAGSWTGEEIRFTYAWFVPFKGKTLSRAEEFKPKQKLAGERIGCSVYAENGGGSIGLSSLTVRIRGG